MFQLCRKVDEKFLYAYSLLVFNYTVNCQIQSKIKMASILSLTLYTLILKNYT